MQWIAGDFMCRICQMLKQFGMFASSIHVVVSLLSVTSNGVFVVLSPERFKRQNRTI